jgi:hypothetical protein
MHKIYINNKKYIYFYLLINKLNIKYKLNLAEKKHITDKLF